MELSYGAAGSGWDAGGVPPGSAHLGTIFISLTAGSDGDEYQPDAEFAYGMQEACGGAGGTHIDQRGLRIIETRADRGGTRPTGGITVLSEQDRGG